MKKITYKDLIKSVEQVDAILSDLGIEYRSHDRVQQAIKLIKRLESVRKDDRKRREFMISNNKDGQILTSLSELYELKHVLENIESWDKNVLKEKLLKILNGTLLPSKETPKNSHARNILFELSLAADFNRAGLVVRLNAVNPDISVHVGKKTYFVQCKRVFSEAKVSKLIAEAKKQLINDFDNNEGENFGVIALSLSRIFTKGVNILESKSSITALQYLDYILIDFINKNSEMWKMIDDKRIIAIMLHVSIPVVLKEESITAWGRQITVNNIHDQDSLRPSSFDVLANDFADLKPTF